jgi:hypothetical protein
VPRSPSPADLRRALRKPPRVIARRVLAEAAVELERFRAPVRGRRFGDDDLCRATGAVSIERLWDAILARPYPFVRSGDELAELERRWPAERGRVLDAAHRALAHEIDLLGTGPVQLGSPIDWQRDWKTGRRWPLRYGRRLEYAELDRPSDVKVPWEISRVQWLLPAGQAYLLTREEEYAAGVRTVLEDWLRGNPYALGVNWVVAMEAALRILSWSWLLYACAASVSWSDARFRSRLLRSLYLHAGFVERNIERSDINGNHYTADAAGLVVAGLVLGVERWADEGWRILVEELPRQVHPDGVDFEASTAYHRLVGELFAVPALLRRAHGLEIPPSYVDRLVAMGRFTAAYTGPDGLGPLWGDADDGRALPLGGQDVNDHASLPVLAAALAGDAAPGNAEAAWLVGPAAVDELPAKQRSAAFPDGGVYILRDGGDHVFVDCGPVGLAGRGGHGHNDCLSFEAVLDGERVITDSGSYVYTASAIERNRFRSTAAHNTPQVDGVEQNRIPTSLWLLHDDAKPEPQVVEDFRFRGAHTGYLRLPRPVHVVRTIVLDPGVHALLVRDELEGDGEHDVEIPFHLAPQLEPKEAVDAFTLGRFVLRWRGEWQPSVASGWVSRSYGTRVANHAVVFRRSGEARPLDVVIAPAEVGPDAVWAWADEQT